MRLEKRNMAAAAGRGRRGLPPAAALATLAVLGGCSYNPFTDPHSYVGPGPSEPVAIPLADALSPTALSPAPPGEQLWFIP